MRKQLSLIAIGLFIAPLLAAQTNRPSIRIAGRRVVEPVPSLGVFMLAFENVKKGTDVANPRLVAAMKKVFAEDPGAADLFERLHKRYVALTPEQRLAVVGPELASATAETRLSPELIRRAIHTPVSIRVVPNAAVKPQWPTEAEIAAAKRRVRVSRSDVRGETVPDEPPSVISIRAGSAEQTFGALEKPTQTLPKITIPPPTYYSFRYKGLFCSDEGSDGGSSSEPYVIFNMTQGDKVWTKLYKYSGIDTYDKVYVDKGLLEKSTLSSPLHIEAILMENDSWDPSEVAGLIQNGVSIYCEYETGGDCPKAAMDILGTVLKWVFDIFENDDDLVASPVHETIDPKTYFNSAYHQPADDHGFWRTEAMKFDGTKTDDGKYWLFFELRKVNQ